MLTGKGRVLFRFVVMLLLQFILIMLKITGVISHDWVVVLIPVWIIIFWELFTLALFLWMFRK